jgi:pilus assembly protein CpaD
MTRHVLLASSLLALALGAAACTTPAGGKGPPPITPTERYSMKVQEHPEQMAFAPHADGLSDAQRAALSVYAQGWLADGGGPISIATPKDGGDAASRVAWAVKARLQAMGVADEDIQVAAYDADHAGAPVLIAYQRFEAVVPKCNQSWTNLAATRNNDTQKNFGCALTANMAAQIENPRDIKTPHAVEASDATRRETVLGHYRKGESTATKSDDQNAGKASSVGQN